MSATTTSLPLEWANYTDYNATLWDVTYVYSVSGCYTFFQRILFYLVIIFVFTFRFFEWFTAAGIAFVVSLSTTAALHAMVVSLQPEVGRDLDHCALMIILTPVTLGAIVYDLYPPPVFNRNPKPLFIVWTCILSLSQACLTFNFPRFLAGLFEMSTTILCDETATICNDNCTSLFSNALFRTANDQCAAFFIGSWGSLNETWNYTGGYYTGGIQNESSSYIDGAPDANSNDSINAYINSTWRYIIVGLITGVLLRSTVLNLYCRPRKARDKVFRRLLMKRTVSGKKLFIARILTWILYTWNVVVFLIWPLILLDLIVAILFYCSGGRKLSWVVECLEDDLSPSAQRIRFAKFMASMWYSWALLAYLAWPVLTIYETVRIESIFYGMLPESESIQAVGQWSSWVAVGLAFMAVLIGRMCMSSKDAVENKKDAIFLNSLDNAVRLPTKSPLATRDPPKWFGTWHGCWEYMILAAEEWENYKSWYKDPVHAMYSALEVDTSEEKGEEIGVDLESVWSKRSWLADPERPKSISTDDRDCQRKRWARYVPCACDSCKQEGESLLDVASLYTDDDFLGEDELKRLLQKNKEISKPEDHSAFGE
jgi:hypothetical protein